MKPKTEIEQEVLALSVPERVMAFCILGKSLMSKDMFGTTELHALGALAQYIGQDIRMSRQAKDTAK